jgi:hypothetical protein
VRVKWLLREEHVERTADVAKVARELLHLSHLYR